LKKCHECAYNHAELMHLPVEIYATYISDDIWLRLVGNCDLLFDICEKDQVENECTCVIKEFYN
ncbi:unnamed protein product, partial [Ceratitis capitata]